VVEPLIRCTVDALHLIEYYAVTYSRDEFGRRLEELRGKYPSHVAEALSMAKIMARVLPVEDVEKTLCERIVEYIEPAPARLTEFREGES
jgi:putative DNA methylase